ncbi:MAG: branched-chain amino acid ABC transporter ATP-binding protein [Mesorhizobium sp. 61-13]|nr:MAG: branched-chain amino acid ABC transporter ATP-binding protein [Mesorhizobium sp. 61-13]
MNRLIIENLSAGYGAVSVLHQVSIEVSEGEFVALLGTNGNGKSTLLNCIMGFIKPTSGRIVFEQDGHALDLTALPPHEIVRRGLSMVPEGRRLVPSLSVEDNLKLAGSNPVVRDRLNENLAYCYRTFPLLLERKTQLAGTMSGGQQQLLAIARSLMTVPKIVVVDEPSVGLAPIVVSQVIEAIRTLQRESNLTILMAEQSFLQTIDVASRAYILAHGRIARHFDRNAGTIDQEEIRRALLGAG